MGWEREGWTEPHRFEITRAIIPIESVKWAMLADGVGYVQVIQFSRTTATDLVRALERLRGQGMRRLVMDLRDDPGGVLESSIELADIFLRSGTILTTAGNDPAENSVENARAAGTEPDYPLVVLVNGGSASASEIVAGALQDHKRALILGTQTFGKGSVQTIIPMSDGAGLRLTTARYYTPNGTSIQAKGITPDVLVPERSPYAEQPDTNGKPKKTLRESDLRHHLKNGNEPVKNGNEPAEEKQDTPPAQDDKKIEDQEKAAPPDDAESDQKLEDVEKDYQLNTALTVLKSLKVFSGQRQN